MSAHIVPAKQWLEKQGHSPALGKAVPFTGLLSLDDQLQIHNWFWENIPNAKSKMHEWIATVPAAHARTLLVAACHCKQIENDWEVESKQSNYENLEQYVIEQAWELLQEYTGKTDDGRVKKKSVDVDVEALEILDQHMFDRSEAAGPAGNCQWGLNKGMNENNWDPWDVGAPERGIGYSKHEASEPIVSTKSFSFDFPKYYVSFLSSA